MRIGAKIAAGFAVAVVAMLAIAAVSLYLLARLSQEWVQMSSINAKRGEAMMSASRHLTSATINFRYFIYRGADYAERFGADLDAMDGQLKAYRALGNLSDEESGMLESAAGFTRQYREGMADVVKRRAEKGVDLRILDVTAQGNDKVLGAVLARLTELSNQRAEASSLEISRLIDSGRRWLAGAALAAVVLAFAVALSLARSITRPLAESVRVADRVAAGDLSATLEVHRSDEAGQLMAALQGMNSGLTRIVADVRVGADAIADSVSQLAAGHDDLSRRTETQAASLEEASSSMEQFAASARQTAEHARKADQLAQGAAASAEEGNRAMARVVGNMDAISAASRKVSDITGVIDSIAFQTNILALNAAVEAARAGDQGRGFAVVAAEVRSLAQRSAQAAKEIKALIGDSSRHIEQGGQLVAHVGETIEGIVAQAKDVSAVIAQISLAAKEQSEGVGQVTQTVAQLEQVTQQNAGLVEQASAATSALSEQAERLAATVSVFRLAGGHGGSGAPSQLPEPAAAPALPYPAARG